MPTASLRHLFDASGAVLVEPALCSDPASRREAAEEAKKEGNLCFAADSFLDAACSYARGLAVLSSREGGGGGGGADEGESSASAGAGEGGKGLACGVRVAVSGQGGGLEKEGMIAYDNEVMKRASPRLLESLLGPTLGQRGCWGLCRQRRP